MRSIKASGLYLILFSAIAFGLESPRQKELINFDWKFAYGDYPDAKSMDFNDSDWQIVQLPHDASIYGPFVNGQLGGAKNNGFRPRSIGWYRKTLTAPANLEGKRIFLEFEGVFMAADVWLNGKHLGLHPNGYLDFYFDVTEHIRPGDNVIAVRYDNTELWSSRWYTGEGIYRDVWLATVNELHIQYWGGIYVTTPQITEDSADVVVETKVQNESDKEQLCTLLTEVKDKKGKPVAQRISYTPIPAGQVYTFSQKLVVPKPQLWSIENPYLYEVVSTVSSGEKQMARQDECKTSIGIRRVEFTPEQGFLLNNKKVFLKGVNIHHDYGCIGAASFDVAIERRLKALKKMGCNAIRLSHNPHDRVLLEMCDRMGILIFDEMYDRWENQYYGKAGEFNDLWRQDVRAFIERDRNHPCVFIWSVGNEVKQQRFEKNHYGSHQLRDMVDYIHQIEPSRKVTAALYPARRDGVVRKAGDNYTESEPAQMAFYMDVMSVNYMENFFARDRQKYPQLIYLLSEASATNMGDCWFNYDHSYTCGQFYWGGTDYIGESFAWPSKGWVNGLLNLCDEFKPIAYYVQSFYSAEPMVRIAIFDEDEDTKKLWNDVDLRFQPMHSHWNWKEGQMLNLMTFTNCRQVELFVNNKSLGVKNLADAEKHKIQWHVPYKSGTIKAVGRIDKKVVSEHILKTAGKPVCILLNADRNTIVADGLDLAYITVMVVDENGISVPVADNLIKFTVASTGTNAGVCSGNLLSDELWQSDQRKAYEGRCLLVVRAKRQPGTISIKADAEGLKPASLVLKVK